MLLPKACDQGRDVTTAEAGRRGDAQMTAGFDTAGRDTGLRIGHVGQQALAVFQKGAALVRQADAARGAHQEFDAKPAFQRVNAPAHDGGRDAGGIGGRRQTAAGGH